MANFREIEKGVVFATKVRDMPAILFEKEWDIVAIKSKTYLELIKQYPNVLHKSIKVRGTIPCMLSLSKKFDLLRQVQIASSGTIAVVPKNSISAKKYIEDAKKHVALYEAYQKNEALKEKKEALKEKKEALKEKMRRLKNRVAILKQSSLDQSQAQEAKDISAKIEKINRDIKRVELRIPNILSMMGLIKQVGLGGGLDNYLARSWELLGEYSDKYYAFKYKYITMTGFFYDSVERGKALKNVFENKIILKVLPVQNSIYSVEQNVNKEFLKVIANKIFEIFDGFKSPFIAQEDKEVVPPLLPPSSGNIINLLFSGVLNGEMETEDMGKVLVKGSTLKKRKRVDNFMVDTLSQELYVFKTRDYSIVRESIM